MNLKTALNLPPCKPPVWARSAHQQTVLGHLIPSTRLVSEFRWVSLDLGDGDQLVAKVCTPQGGARDLGDERGVVVHFFHGLGGSAEGDYMERSANVCTRLGFTAVLWNHRGSGAGAGKARKIYHAGIAGDLYRALGWGRGEFPRAKHLAVGFSLSGNALLLALSGCAPRTATGNHIDPVMPDGALAVNGAIDLALCAEKVSQGFNRVYDLRFVKLLREDVAEREQIGGKALKGVKPWSKLADFDAEYTAPEAGFKSRADYYRECSAGPHLAKITTPTIIITAEDDPFVPVTSYKSAQLSPSTHLHIEPSGGHMGYLTQDRHPIYGMRWLDQAIEASVKALLA